MTVPSFHDIPKQEHEVTPLELFFDLVFVFAVSQLSHHLLTQLSWRGAAETLVMLLTIIRSMVFNKLVGYHDPGRSIPDPLVGLGGNAVGLVHERCGDEGIYNIRLGVCLSPFADSTRAYRLDTRKFNRCGCFESIIYERFSGSLPRHPCGSQARW
jgi:hypothetical protein